MRAFLKIYGASFLSGILLFLAFPSTHWHPLAWIALVPLLLHVRDLSPKDTAKYFFLAGWVFHSLLLQWLISNVFWAGGWAIWGYQGLCVYMALVWSLLGFSWKHIAIRLPRVGVILPFVLLWGVMEYVQSIAFSGFGWGALAHSQSYNLYAFQWGSLGGFILIGLGIVAVNGLIAECVADKAKRFRHAGSAIVLLLAIHGGGYWMLHPTEYSTDPVQVGIYQSNTPNGTKWDVEFRKTLFDQALFKSRIIADETPVDLFVWPEALILTNIQDEATHAPIQSLLNDTQADLFAGAQRQDGSFYYNSSYLMKPEGDASLYYDKIHLAPFGEYVPFANVMPVLRNFVPSMGDQTPGEVQHVFDTQGRKLGPLICFEVLFSPMSQQLRAEGADFLVVVTNLAWFGSSNALSQELAIAKLRAVETRLPLVQSANTGYSGIIDPWGRYVAVDRFIDEFGRIYQVRADIPPEGTAHQRLIGVLPLPEASTPPIPNGPLYFPYIVCVLFLGLIVCALTQGKANGSSVQETS